MKRTALALTLILALFVPLAIGVQSAKSSSKTIVVPDDYSTIQAAINSANNGDTIFVKNGIYNESLNIESKSLSLIGEDRKNTIIVGKLTPWGMPPVISLYTFDTLITGFTIRNHDIATDRLPIGGIYLESATNCSIRGNNIINSKYGILLDGSWNIDISGNNITDNQAEGVNFYRSSNNRVSENNISGNGLGILSFEEGRNNTINANRIENNTDDGIGLRIANSCLIYGNNIAKNNNSGIHLSDNTTNVVVDGNNLTDNKVGIRFDPFEGLAGNFNKFYHNNLLNNSQQVFIDTESIQNWDNGKEGNYWSDYTIKYPSAVEESKSGTWNTPYVINENNKDSYPLINQVDISNIVPEIPTEPFPTILVISGGLVAVVAVAGLIYWKKRRHEVEHP